MKTAERIVMVMLLACFIGGGLWIYLTLQYEQKEIVEAVARGEYEIPMVEDVPEIAPEKWRTIYPYTIPVTIGGVLVEASVADDLVSRIKGLSGTPFLPDNVVKLFAFGVTADHSVWMKDMEYPLDIMWVTETGEIVHIEENVSPDSYPESFSSPVPAWYVLEANAGFVVKNDISLGEEVILISQN